MKTIKVSEATNIQLDWLVAKCEGYSATIKPLEIVYAHPNGAWHHNGNWKPTEKSVQMWPIIEREEITIDYRDSETQARKWTGDDFIHALAGKKQGLIAAARCFVASKLGDTVEVPEELK